MSASSPLIVYKNSVPIPVECLLHASNVKQVFLLTDDTVLHLPQRYNRFDDPAPAWVLNESTYYYVLSDEERKRRWEQYAHLRVKREWAILRRISHPGVVALRECAVANDGRIGFTQEKLAPVCFERGFRNVHLSTLPRWLLFGANLLNALEAVHTAGFVHVDVKPDNIGVRLSPDGIREPTFPVLFDFNISTMHGRRPSLTQRPTQVDVCGSPQYMSPEQARGLPVDGRSDIFSAAVTLLSILVGRIGFAERHHRSFYDVMTSIVSNFYPHWKSFCFLVPNRHVQTCFARALAKSPEARYQSAASFAQALYDAMSHLSRKEWEHSIPFPKIRRWALPRDSSDSNHNF